MTATMVYEKDGNAVSDFDLETELSWIISWSEDKDHKFYYSTSNIFSRVRKAIVEGDMDCTTIQFEFDDEVLPINKYGALLKWPNGFCDTEIRMAEDILRGAMGMKKIERSK